MDFVGSTRDSLEIKFEATIEEPVKICKDELINEQYKEYCSVSHCSEPSKLGVQSYTDSNQGDPLGVSMGPGGSTDDPIGIEFEATIEKTAQNCKDEVLKEEYEGCCSFARCSEVDDKLEVQRYTGATDSDNQDLMIDSMNCDASNVGSSYTKFGDAMGKSAPNRAAIFLEEYYEECCAASYCSQPIDTSEIRTHAGATCSDHEVLFGDPKKCEGSAVDPLTIDFEPIMEKPALNRDTKFLKEKDAGCNSVFKCSKLAEQMGVQTQSGDEQQLKPGDGLRFHCIICRKDLKKKREYDTHMEKHAVIKNLQLFSINGIKYGNKNVLQHLLETHTVEKLFFCDICGMNFVRKAQLATHRDLHSKALQLLFCDFCNDSFASKKLIASHLHQHTCDLSSCELCDKRFKWKYSQKKHMSSIKNKQHIPRNICGKKLTTKEKLADHIELHIAPKPFTCDICHKEYRYEKYLITHMQKHTDETRSSCRTRGTIFKNKGESEKHKKIHPSEYSSKVVYTCNTCKKMFKHKNNLRRHESVHENMKAFQCNVCNESFYLKMDLKQHSRLHTGKGVFVCKVCNKSIASKRGLAGHMRIHTGERPFSCPKCKKSFKLKCTLSRHLMLHENTKNFPCKVCGKRFIAQYRLKLHCMNMHENIKPYSCELCEKRYVRPGELRLHMKTHLDEKPYVCRVCDRGFSYKSVLNKHMKKHLRDNLLSYDACKEGLTKSELDALKAAQSHKKSFSCEMRGKNVRHVATHRVHSLNHKGKESHCREYHAEDFIKDKLNGHSTSNTGEQSFVCKICGKGCSKELSLKQHMKFHDSLDRREFLCKLCGERLASKQIFATHMEMHTTTKIIRHEGADEDSTNEQYLSSRGQQHSRESRIPCNTCGAAFQKRCEILEPKETSLSTCRDTRNTRFRISKNEDISSKHTRQMGSVEFFTCDVCHRTFLSNKAWRRHMILHTGKWPFSCEICGGGFFEKFEKVEHLRIHTGEKPFSCEYCGKSFRVKIYLRKHEALHKTMEAV